ncbi:cadherin-like protein 26 [Thalassophryne amazonica]|uniref:cadherin-like protein 26 n=1 Tax=Thalassophryne amazonica TaxID=390379 RepID=UPI0014711F91|nr:cadherin-like protein 26 [Thalassophryne amazonica]
MRTILTLMLMVAFAALAECRDDSSIAIKHSKWEVLSRSKRRWVLSTIELQEEDRGPYPKHLAQMFNDKTDNTQKGHKFRISGMGVTEEPLGVISIDEHTGIVSALKSVDREKYDLFHIKFDILDKVTGRLLDKELAFDVEIKDINDNPPKFQSDVMRVGIKENFPEGYLPASLHAFDTDQKNTPNSEATITVLSQEPKEPKIDVKQEKDSNTAQLTFTGCFDYDKANHYKIIVQATDHGTPALSSTATVSLFIADSNTHPPVFKERSYHGEVLEMASDVDVLRVAVEDKDTPKTPAWRAKYFFIKGNEDNNYKIETDPETNEGILHVIKGKDFEKTTLTTLQIGVENEEALFHCKDKTTPPPPVDSVNITVKIIDVNDPPEFDKKNVDVYQKEEEEPGKVLHTPKVKDVDSDVSNIRFKLLEDPANWVTIDEKTGKLTSAKKMDRESPHVNDNVYKIVIGAIDDGEPQATGTCTVLVHLGDINDNTPKLSKNGIVMCGNKEKMIMVPVNDSDADPFSGPFAFFLSSDDTKLKELWKLDPSVGMEGGLVSLRILAYGNYSVPLVIQDQQGSAGRETLVVIVCDCGQGQQCLGKWPLTKQFGAPGIGLLFLGLLAFLLLLLLIVCQCGGKTFKSLPPAQDEGSQTLIKYNQEGGGSACKADPALLLSSITNKMTVIDSAKPQPATMTEVSPITSTNIEIYNRSRHSMVTGPCRNSLSFIHNLCKGHGSSHVKCQMSNNMAWGRQQLTARGQGGLGKYSTWSKARSNSYWANTSRTTRSLSVRGIHDIGDYIDRRLYMIDGNDVEHPVYQPHKYAYEGESSKCPSLDKLSLSNLGEDLQFLNDLGPKFKTLGSICNQTIQNKNIQT